MKKVWLLFFGLMVSGFGFANEITQPHIKVFGKSTIQVEPDTMIWHLKIKTEDTNLNLVSQKHAKTVSKVLKIIRAKNIDRKSVQTSNMSFGENRVYQNHAWTKKGYAATTSVTFKLNDFKDYESLWLSLSEINAVSVHDVKFDHSDRIGFRNKARKKALLAAKNKAHIMAKTLGVEIGQPISIAEIEHTYNSSLRSNMVNVVGGAASESSISLGTIPISMKVKLVMNIITK